MIIAVASGKGGTGKTTVATSLAITASGSVNTVDPSQAGVRYLDCDVEAPNAHLFLKPTFQERREVGILIPEIDENLCTHCGRCADVCQYHAIAVLGKKTLVFPQLCHGCGSCTRECPEGAIREKLNVIGALEHGITVSGVDFAHGVLEIGEPMAVPIIRQLKSWLPPLAGQLVILDSPPGTSCPVVETMRGADFILLVTEPTPFGLHDLKLAAAVAGELAIPVGVVINRDGMGDQRVDDFCTEAGIPVLLRIPFDRRIAEAVSRGQALVTALPAYQPQFEALLHEITSATAEGGRR